MTTQTITMPREDDDLTLDRDLPVCDDCGQQANEEKGDLIPYTPPRSAPTDEDIHYHPICASDATLAPVDAAPSVDEASDYDVWFAIGPDEVKGGLLASFIMGVGVATIAFGLPLAVTATVVSIATFIIGITAGAAWEAAAEPRERLRR